MYIYKIIIENFRNLTSFEWKPNKNVNILFGHNGSGKTNVAEALAMAFSTSKFNNYFDKVDYYLGDETSKIKIQVWLDDIEDLKIEKSLILQHLDENDGFICDDTDCNIKKAIILQLESGIDRKMEWDFFIQTGVKPCSLSNREEFNFVYIDANRQPLKEIGLNGKSLLYQLSKDKISDEVSKISQEIVDIANRKLSESTVINDFIEELSDLSSINFIEAYKMLFKNPSTNWNYSGYEMSTITQSTEISFERQSKGMQNIFLLLLMKKKLAGSGIVFIEELEQNLEPKYQRYIADEYRKMNVGQLFITSHSADVISHFEYDSIFNMAGKIAKHIFLDIEDDIKKEICRLNKKEFISALMASKILLIEGESEYAAFPVYAYCENFAFSRLDIEIINVGGKSKFEKYATAFKKFGKEIYILIDNDDDVKAIINTIDKIADRIYLAKNCYEDMIVDYIKNNCDELNDLIDFKAIVEKLLSIKSYDEGKAKKIDTKKMTVKSEIFSKNIELSNLTKYSDIASFDSILKYILHDSFTNSYFARGVANIIAKNECVPKFFKELINDIGSKVPILAKYDNYVNTYKLMGDNYET